MRNDIEEISKALSYIGSHDRDLWIRMGAGIKTELGEAGFNIWDSWSATAENYNAQAAKSAWKSLKPGMVNIASVFYEARQQGYTAEKPYQKPDSNMLLALQKEREEKLKQAEAERQKKASEAKLKAQELWSKAQAANPNHPYLVKKGIVAEQIKEIKQLNNNLLIPLRQNGELVSLQFIDTTGKKTFLPGGIVKGSAMIIGNTTNMRKEGYLIAEGFATAATLNRGSNKPVVVAFNAGNLKNVSETLAKYLPNTNVSICADNDPTGIKKAKEAQKMFANSQVKTISPYFIKEDIDKFQSIHGEHTYPTDFNDLQELKGINEVKKQLDQLGQVLERKSERTAWGDFPEVIRNDNIGTLKKHSEYIPAKQGDPEMAQELVKKVFNPKTIQKIATMLQAHKNVCILPIMAEEAVGKNKIPQAMAKYLGNVLNIPINENILQINKVSRTGKGIDHRFAFQPIFEGPVEKNKNYLLVDDSISVGGSIASLRGYIENRGGNVIGAAVMTGHELSLNIVPEKNMIESIINKHGNKFTEYWKEEFGYEIDKSTRAESGHIRQAKDVDSFRNRIATARYEGILRMDENLRFDRKSQFSTGFTGMEGRQAPPIKQSAIDKTATSAVFFHPKESKGIAMNEQQLNSIEVDLDRRTIDPETVNNWVKNRAKVSLEPEINSKINIQSTQKESQKEPILGVLRRPKAPPFSIQNKYLFSQGKYFDIDTGKTVLFEDTGRKLITAKEDIQTVHDMLEVVKEKGWDSIKLSGTQEFKRLTYIEAESQGIKTKGYSPSPEDIEMVNRHREEMSLNKVAEFSHQSIPSSIPNQPNITDSKSIATQPSGDKVIDFGAAPFEFKQDNKESYFITLDKNGVQKTVWGIGLKEVIAEKNIQKNDYINLKNIGKTPVEVRQEIKNDQGETIDYKTIKTHRNAWEVDVIHKESNQNKTWQDPQQIISDIDKKVIQSSSPSKAQINTSIEADSNFQVKPENIPEHTIPSEVLLSASSMKSVVNQDLLNDTKLNYEQKATDLSPHNLVKLRTYEKHTMDVIDRIQPQFRDQAKLNFYDSTSKFMNGQELNLPEPQKQELKHDLGVSDQPNKDVQIEDIDISR